MSHWLDDYPPLRIMQKQIPAADYNCIRISLIREKLPWQIPLKNIHCMVCILDEHAWICIDECHNNQPILAWTNFHKSDRTSLETPVMCELHLYHIHAGLVMGSALDALSLSVAEHQRENAIYNQPVSILDR